MAEQPDRTCLALLSNHPNPKRRAPRVCKPCLRCYRWGGRVLSSLAFSCLPRILHPRYQDIVQGCGVLDLHLGPQFVELEVGLQAPYNGLRAIQQITLWAAWRPWQKDSRFSGVSFSGAHPPYSAVPTEVFRENYRSSGQSMSNRVGDMSTVFGRDKYTIAAESHRLALRLVPGAPRYQRVTQNSALSSCTRYKESVMT